MRFEKWQALGNDYVIVEADALPWKLTVGAHQAHLRTPLRDRLRRVLLLSRVSDPDYVAELRIFNPDGSEAELSGNGAREAVLYLRAARLGRRATTSRSSPGGAIRPTITGPDTATLDMGRGLRHVARLPLRRAPTRRDADAAGASGPSSTSRSATRSARSMSGTRSTSSTSR